MKWASLLVLNLVFSVICFSQVRKIVINRVDTNCFSIGENRSFGVSRRIFPRNTLSLSVSADSLYVEIDNIYTGNYYIKSLADTNYVNGLTGLNFSSASEIISFYLGYMIK